MILVANASVLVAELLRTRGRALLSHPDLRIVVAEQQWDETQYELARRLAAIVERGKITSAQAASLHARSVHSSTAESSTSFLASSTNT